MTNALIGYTGYVGATLLKQSNFEFKYRSINIEESKGGDFNLVVCSAAPAQKWISNREPEADLQNILSLIESLKTIKCKTFVLISTVDVFKNPIGIDEDTFVEEEGLHPYGLHRRLLEKFVEQHFSNYLIVRLPGLVGPGLRKNIIFDFLNHNNLDAIESRNVFQFYPMINLWYDIQIALNADLKLIHLTASPISVAEISSECFGTPFNNTLSNTLVYYDFKSKYAAIFDGQNDYQYSKRETIQAVRAYAQSEPITLKVMNEITA